MTISDNKANYGTASDCIIKSIGVCVATPSKKKQPPCVFVAYTTSAFESKVNIIPMKLPRKAYTEKDFLSVICQAENTKRVTYLDFNGEPKDIYVCREDSGKIIDIVERDHEKNKFLGNFAEIVSSHLKFSTPEFESVSFNEPMMAEVSYGSSLEYERGGYQYALINAYNACLLGRAFSREELRLETKSAQKAKYEVKKATPSRYIDEASINVRPVFVEEDGVVNYYITEQISIIDGDTECCRAYKISYTSRLNDYNVVRQ